MRWQDSLFRSRISQKYWRKQQQKMDNIHQIKFYAYCPFLVWYYKTQKPIWGRMVPVLPLEATLVCFYLLVNFLQIVEGCYMTKTGIFVGMLTLDFLYLTANYPHQNQKIVASNYAITAGGPATNAGVAFSYFGNRARLLASLGNHPITQLIKSDLDNYQIEIQDLDKNRSQPPPVSSIITTKKTGDRAVISIDAPKTKISKEAISLKTIQQADIVLIDGHQMAASLEIAKLAREKNIPVVIDGGSWKPGFEEVLALADYVICSANFYPPGCQLREEVFAYLSNLNIPDIVITGGEEAIAYLNRGNFGKLEVPQIQPVDTLGAGDIFHGAFCHYILQQQNFLAALESAAEIASYSCQFFGTREWMKNF